MFAERKHTMNINFAFPDGCREKYTRAEDIPTLPRVGDFIQSSRPQSGRYRVQAVVFEIDDETMRCESIVVELEALDRVST